MTGSERLSIDGVGIELRRIGAAAGAHGPAPTLVFLHDGLGSVSTWRDFPDLLAAAAGMPGLIYSRPGYGRSDPVTLPRPLSYMHDEARGLLPALLEAEGIDDAILIGHSDGASIALIYAATEHGAAMEHGQGRVRGLGLLAPHVFCEPRSVAAIEEARETFLHGDLRRRLAKHHDHVEVAFSGWNGAWLDPGFAAWNLEELLPQVRAPMLLIQSEDDPFGTLRQLEAIAAGAGGRVDRLILRDCGHSPQRDRPRLTLAALLGLITAVTDEATSE